MIRFLLGAAVGVAVFINPEARQITADLLRAAGDALAPAKDGDTLQDRIKSAVEKNVLNSK